MTIMKRITLIALAAFLVLPIFLNTSAAQASFYSNIMYPDALADSIRIPTEEIFRRNCDAVFLIETFDIDGDSIRTGTGFFISETGLAVTNLHVINDAESAVITLYNGDIYPVRGVNAVSEEFNLIIFSIDSDKIDWNYLTSADSELIEAGNTVYVIGSPLGYINTMSGGIISNAKREVEGEDLIQFTAPISFGSGGSPLFNTRGEVIGVTSSSFSYGQNLNLAVPINHIKSMNPGECISLSDLIVDSESELPDTDS